MDHYTEF